MWLPATLTQNDQLDIDKNTTQQHASSNSFYHKLCQWFLPDGGRCGGGDLVSLSPDLLGSGQLVAGWPVLPQLEQKCSKRHRAAKHVPLLFL